MSKPQRLILAVLDGFGLSPATTGNAIYQANTPTVDRLAATYPYVALKAHGTEVGLRWGEMGNSEVGHLNIGAGRVVVQDVTRISRMIEEGSFGQNEILRTACDTAAKGQGALHVIVLASPGGVHGHVRYVAPLLQLAKERGVSRVRLHLIADGRDAEPKSIEKFLPTIEQARAEFGGEYASLSGRYYAMDRDRHWDRTQAAYEAIVRGQGERATTIQEAIQSAYGRDESDEFIRPTVIGQPFALQPNDVVVFTNHRPDRARQLARALAGSDFTDFTRPGPIAQFVTFTNYGVQLENTMVAFDTDPVPRQLADVLDEAGLRQLHVAETEKYAHVTYFLNGYVEEPFSQEMRRLIQSPKVETYDQAPAMAAGKVTESVLEAYAAASFDVAFVNYANADMVGHTGNLAATVEAIQVLDAQLQQLAEAVEATGDVLIVTADHGNAEQLIHPDTGDIDKEHTTNPIPFMLVAPQFRHRPAAGNAKSALLAKAPVGILGDVAPTVLGLLGLPQPSEMTGQSLLAELKRAGS